MTSSSISVYSFALLGSSLSAEGLTRLASLGGISITEGFLINQGLSVSARCQSTVALSVTRLTRTGSVYTTSNNEVSEDL